MRAKAVFVALAMLVSVGSAAPRERLDNASAGELCWDLVRSLARERYATTPIRASMPGSPLPPVKGERKNFPGIRAC